MKKRTKIVALLLVVAMAMLALVSCGGGNVADSGNAVVVIENEEGKYTVYEVDLSSLDSHDEGALSLLKHLSAKEENPLSFSATWGAYGAYITAIGGIAENTSEGKYVSVYTSNEADFDTTAWVKSLEYDGKTFKTSGVGVSQMNIEDGTAVLFRLEGY